MRSAGTIRLPPAPAYLPLERNPAPTHALKTAAKDFTNPAYVGPGMWVAIHTLAKSATTYEKKKAFIEFMTTLRTSFPCPTCRQHLNTYLDSHPFDPFWKKVDPTTGEEVGLLEWSFLFHNAVNVRLGKPVADWATVKALYSAENDVCSLDCQDAH